MVIMTLFLNFIVHSARNSSNHCDEFSGEIWELRVVYGGSSSLNRISQELRLKLLSLSLPWFHKRLKPVSFDSDYTGWGRECPPPDEFFLKQCFISVRIQLQLLKMHYEDYEIYFISLFHNWIILCQFRLGFKKLISISNSPNIGSTAPS